MALRKRLEDDREGLEREILTRVQGVTDPAAAGDPAYAAGLRTAVRAALAYGIDAIGADEPPSSAPPEVLRQARSAANLGVALDTVLRRYFAGHALVSDFLIGEAGAEANISPAGLKEVVRSETEAFENLIRLVSDAYAHEADSKNRTVEERRGERLRRILNGESTDTDELGYDFDSWHLGLLATGPEARATLRALASTLDRRLLLTAAGPVLWAWLGGRERLASSEVIAIADSHRSAGTRLAAGEPCRDLSGWRLTHRQAKAAMPIAERGASAVIRYIDVALLASALSDEVLTGSLYDIYLKPLDRDRDRGAVLRETLSAYFSAGRNVSSAAAALRVNRKTVSARLQAVESSIGQPIDACSAELETAIRLWELKPEPSYPPAA